MAEEFVEYAHIGYTTLSVTDTAKTLAQCADTSLITQGGLRKVILQNDPEDGANCRYTLDDAQTTPTAAAVGKRMDSGDIIELTAHEARNAQFVRDADTSLTLQCHFYYTD